MYIFFCGEPRMNKFTSFTLRSVYKAVLTEGKGTKDIKTDLLKWFINY